MLNSGPKKSRKIPSVLNFFLQHHGEIELSNEIGKVEHISLVKN
jgi:hypothetical protein